MSALYNEYLTGAEREAAIIVAESDAQFARLNVLFEAVDATLEANMLAAEAKVFAENGTYDDLVMLYKEAGEEAAQKKQGLIATIINAIGNLFAKIGNFLNSKFGKKLENIPEGDTKIDGKLEKEMNLFQKAWNFLKSPIDKIKGGTDAGLDKEEIAKAWGQLVAEFTAIGGAAAGATAAVVVNREKIIAWIKTVRDEIHSKVTTAISALKTALGIGKIAKVVTDATKPKTDDANASENNAENEANAGEDKKESLGDKLLNAGQKVLDALKTFGGWITSWIGKMASAIGLTKKQAEKEADAAPAANTEADNKGKDDNRQYANGDTVGESTTLFGVTLDSDSVLYESEMSDDEYNELCELFNEL